MNSQELISFCLVKYSSISYIFHHGSMVITLVGVIDQDLIVFKISFIQTQFCR